MPVELNARDACYGFWMLAPSLNAIDTFVDALWLEDGLSRNTLADQQPALALDDTAEHHLQA